jgi:hypothetical protein
MKKILLGLLLACVTEFTVTGQTVYSQNFENSMTAIPIGWHQQLPKYDTTNLGWQFDTVFLPLNGGLIYFLDTNSTYLAYVNDIDNNGSRSCNWDTLYSSSFSTLGYSHLFISFDAYYII